MVLTFAVIILLLICIIYDIRLFIGVILLGILINTTKYIGGEYEIFKFNNLHPVSDLYVKVKLRADHIRIDELENHLKNQFISKSVTSTQLFKFRKPTLTFNEIIPILLREITSLTKSNDRILVTLPYEQGAISYLIQKSSDRDTYINLTSLSREELIMFIKEPNNHTDYTIALYNTFKGEEINQKNTLEHFKNLVNNRNRGFIKPNEIDPFKWNNILTDTPEESVTLSVGSIRALHTFSMTKTKYLIIVDIDRDIIEFNRMNLELIRRISQMPKYRNNSKKQKSVYIDFYLGTETAEQLDDINSLEMSLFKAFLETIPNQEEILSSIRNKSAFYMNVDLWDRIVSAINDNRITVLQGSISDIEFMGSISTVVSKNQLKFSVLDFSNILEYFEDETTKNNFNMVIEGLPLTDEAKMIWTAGFNISDIIGTYMKCHGSDSSWYYYSCFVKDGKSNKFKNILGYRPVLL